eukprot:CAMPEP_0117085144 /NCGR_PEP_ID=MMETSP0472-20121206/59887_1 /TAXON_ID=693140 ORGANISM="Tiarina fusus, Strain LIS" /NCGR_SAMPLE_ID=MMETSP0472 /ASSEMBLY_ACC=CAM_ASM_000603 /LENGTH=56 /DNA_ID=CAMNT_0004814345 /DNA_START=462 /DNA_END=632 /DNA_ORIENTATION=+
MSLDANVNVIMMPVKELVDGMEHSVTSVVDTNVVMPVKELGESWNQAVDATFLWHL